jgi:hypothetical protein
MFCMIKTHILDPEPCSKHTFSTLNRPASRTQGLEEQQHGRLCRVFVLNHGVDVFARTLSLSPSRFVSIFMD